MWSEDESELCVDSSHHMLVQYWTDTRPQHQIGTSLENKLRCAVLCPGGHTGNTSDAHALSNTHRGYADIYIVATFVRSGSHRERAPKLVSTSYLEAQRGKNTACVSPLRSQPLQNNLHVCIDLFSPFFGKQSHTKCVVCPLSVQRTVC